ncbi:MAG: threonine--tRNA ligase, partial [Zavarzinia sp.]|nr:threonine--tRNA ligase [Zavarzinia sp.]
MSVSLTLPDGSLRSYPGPVSGTTLAADIGPGLAKAALLLRVDGELVDLATVIDHDAKVEIITRKSDEALDLLRHDCAHVMAEAVQELFPGTQVTIGPSIENGFYYDFARAEPFTPDDLAVIEKRMHEIVDRDEKIVREVWDRDEAADFFLNKGEIYKAEIIRDIPAGEKISLYRQGDFIDLCRGPHLPATGKLGHGFKLMKVAGAYWRGDHRNAMLQRIYGTAWRDEKELKDYLHRLEEAERRDHRKLGKEMDLFHIQEEAVGSIFWHAKGWTLYRALESYVRRKIEADGYEEVRTPQLVDSSLFIASGHWEMYGDNMMKIQLEEGKR